MDYSKLTVPKLKAECKERGIRGYSKLTKPGLVQALTDHDATKAPIVVKGRAVGATTMAADQANLEALAKVNQALEANTKRKARNKRKAQRRAMRAAGYPA